jgi:hypothetical protein
VDQTVTHQTAGLATNQQQQQQQQQQQRQMKMKKRPRASRHVGLTPAAVVKKIGK